MLTKFGTYSLLEGITWGRPIFQYTDQLLLTRNEGNGMKRLTFFFMLFLAACGSARDEVVDEAYGDLTGTWSLSSLDLGDSTFRAGDHPNIIIQKYLTNTHFAWLYYDSDADRMIGMAGGTYTVQEDQYIELIDYNLPSGSNRLGQTQVYNYERDGGEWLCTGFEQMYRFEPQKGEIVPMDSISLEQRWSMITPDSKNDRGIQGTWVLKEFRSDEDSVWQTYPDFVRYLKLITPSHFFWVKYNGHYDEVMASGGGPYAYSGGSYYLEKIESFYPHDSHQVGTEITFELSVEDQRWKHRGYIKRIDRDYQDVLIDSSLVDEIWSLYQNPKAY